MERRQSAAQASTERTGTTRVGALRLLGGAALPTAVALALLLAIVLVALLAMGREFSATPQFVATLWLALNHAPLRADGVTLGMLPLLPTILYGAAVAWQARAASEPFSSSADDSLDRAERGVPTEATETAKRAAAILLGGLVLVPLAATGLAVTVLNAAPEDFPARADSVGSALTWTVVINLTAALVGLWAAHSRWVRKRVPQVLVAGMHIGLAFCFGIWALAAVTMLVALGAGWSDLGMLFGIADEDPWGQVALGLLSIAYIPNLLSLVGAVAVGGQAHIGDASASVFSVAPGNLPALPLLAGWPADTPHWTAQVVLVLGACVAIAVARLTAHWFAATRDGVVACFVGAVTAVVVFLVVGLGAGGEVGLLGSAGFSFLVTSGLVIAWVGLLGGATMALSLMGVERRRTAHEDRVRRRRERLAEAAAARSAGFGSGEPASGGDAAAETASTAADSESGDAAAGGAADIAEDKADLTESAVAGEDLDADALDAGPYTAVDPADEEPITEADLAAADAEFAAADDGLDEDADGAEAQVVELPAATAVTTDGAHGDTTDTHGDTTDIADGADPAFFDDAPAGDPETTDELPIVTGEEGPDTEAETDSARPGDKN